MTKNFMHQLKLLKPTHWIFLSMLFATYVVASTTWGVNQASRYELTRSIVLDGKFNIDGREHVTLDWSRYDGHYYSNKAPGSSFLAVVPFFAAVQLEKTLGFDPRTLDELNQKVVDAFASALPTVVMVAFLILYLESLGPNHTTGRGPWLAVLTYALGSIAFPYSATFWGHQVAALFIFVSYFLIITKFQPAWSGFFFGLAVLSEYSVVLFAPAWLYILFSKDHSSSKQFARRAIAFCLGGLPPFFLFAFYHHACFGEWYRLAPTYGNPVFLENAKTLGVLGVPKLGPLYNLLFGSDRGLMVLSPIFLLVPWGIFRWFRSSVRRPEIYACVWVCFIAWIFNGSFNGWYGGCAAGPRYMLICFPFLAVFLHWVPFRWPAVTLLGLSFINMVGVSIVGALICTQPGFLWNQIYPAIVSPELLLKRTLPVGALGSATFFLGIWLGAGTKLSKIQ